MMQNPDQTLASERFKRRAAEIELAKLQRKYNACQAAKDKIQREKNELQQEADELEQKLADSEETVRTMTKENEDALFDCEQYQCDLDQARTEKDMYEEAAYDATKVAEVWKRRAMAYAPQDVREVWAEDDSGLLALAGAVGGLSIEELESSGHQSETSGTDMDMLDSDKEVGDTAVDDMEGLQVEQPELCPRIQATGQCRKLGKCEYHHPAGSRKVAEAYLQIQK